MASEIELDVQVEQAVELEHKERKEAEDRIEKLIAEIKKLQKKKASAENK